MPPKNKRLTCPCQDCKKTGKTHFDRVALSIHHAALRRAAEAASSTIPPGDSDDVAAAAIMLGEMIADTHAPTTSGTERLWSTRCQDLSDASGPDPVVDPAMVVGAMSDLTTMLRTTPESSVSMEDSIGASNSEGGSEDEDDSSQGVTSSATASQPPNIVYTKGGKKDRDNLSILQHVDEKIKRLWDAIQAARATHDDLDVQLVSAAKALPGLRKSLRNIIRKTERVQNRKKEVMVRLNNLEAGVIEFGQECSLPIQHDTGVFFEDPPIVKFDPVAQMVMFLGVCLSVILGTPRRTCDMILNVIYTTLEFFALSHHGSLSPAEETTLRDIPKTIETAVLRFNLDATSTVIYAMCPNCDSRYEPSFARDGVTREYRNTCTNRVNPEDTKLCGHALVEPNRNSIPLKPFVYRSFHDFLATLLTIPEIEQMMEDSNAAILGNIPEMRSDISHGEFLREFEGPDSTPERKVLFVDGKGEGRYIFSLSIDFFNPERTTSRGRSLSCGVISMACLNLPVSIRYKPEFMYMAGLIPGPSEPPEDRLNPYLEPLVQDLADSWKRGIQYSKTALRPEGRVTRSAIALICTDLPATRKVIGFHSSVSHHFCSVCDLYDKKNYGRTDWDTWHDRDRKTDFERAEKWRDASSSAERKKLWDNFGVRWTPLWSLPYFDPCRQVVVDSMHCILEGLVSYHFRYVLRLTALEAKTKDLLGDSFAYDFETVDSSNRYGLTEKGLEQVPRIHRALVAGAAKGEDGTGISDAVIAAHLTKLGNALDRCNSGALLFVIMDVCPEKFPNVELKAPLQAPGHKKSDLIRALIQWRRQYTFLTHSSYTKFASPELMARIQRVINELDAPASLRHVPKNYGTAAAGTLKADEWRTMATIHLALTLISAWDPNSPHPLTTAIADTAEKQKLHNVLRHTMLLVTATRLCCFRQTSKLRAERYRENILSYIKDLTNIHKLASHKSNHHMAIHIARFLFLFGPVRGWWTFPFERLIGRLQRVKINHQVGQLEKTIVTSFHRGVQVRIWLHRPDCPPALKALKNFFDKVFDRHDDETDPDFDPERKKTLEGELRSSLVRDGYEIATTYNSYRYYHFAGSTYSPNSEHVGNSLVRYYSNSRIVWASIEHIITLPTDPKTALLAVRRQLEASPDVHDPFCQYPDFPARLMSANVADNLEIITVSRAIVIGQYARWKFSKDFCVILDLDKE